MDVGAQHLRSMLSGHLGPDFEQVKMLYLSKHHIGFSFSLKRRRCVPVRSGLPVLLRQATVACCFLLFLFLRSRM